MRACSARTTIRARPKPDSLTALWEYAFSPGQRVNPYAVVGVGVTQYRDWYLDFGPVPGSPGWDTQYRLHVLGGLGVRLFLTPHVFVAPEARIGLVPPFPVDGRARLRFLSGRVQGGAGLVFCGRLGRQP